MNQITTLLPTQVWNENQLKVMRRSLCPDATNDEFLQYIHYAAAKQLDPFTQQVILVIYNKDKPDKRRATIITTQSGMRTLAKRAGGYRANSEPAQFEYDEGLKGPANPLGIVRCSINLFAQDNKGDWYPVNGEAYWDEFAPIADEWAYDENAGKRRPTGKKTVTGNWQKMPRLMLQKCATMLALRAGWPDTFSGVYSEEENDFRAAADLDPIKVIEHAEQEDRLNRIGRPHEKLHYFDNQGDPVYVEVGQFADTILRMARAYSSKSQFAASIHGRNKTPLNIFWGLHKDDALQLKKELEKIEAKLTDEKVEAPLG